jgi:hypothetical protein
MDDSSCSASELRQRYHKGGSAADDELTAAQLRARHGISSNQTGKPVVPTMMHDLHLSTGDGC